METKSLTIAKLVKGLPRLRVYDDALSEFEDNNLFKPRFPVVDKNTYLGIEVEVENVEFYDESSPYWKMIDDGSLRNNGREFITPPIRAWRVEHALSRLFNDLNASVDFSERTSIHVHMNIRTLTLDQLETLLLTYLLFEKVLFKFIGNNRYENIFCVPLCESKMPVQLRSLIQKADTLKIDWRKYTALNLLPIWEKGTIEFRHLHGTKDLAKIMPWINMILSLKMFALKHPPEYIWHRIGTLNSTSQYRQFAAEVFGDQLSFLEGKEFNKDISQCISTIKTQCIVNPFIDEVTQLEKDSPLYLAQSLHKVPIKGTLATMQEIQARLRINPANFFTGRETGRPITYAELGTSFFEEGIEPRPTTQRSVDF